MHKYKIGLVQLTTKDSLVVDLLPSNENRSTITKTLVAWYGLDNALENECVEIINYRYASNYDLTQFHTRDYIDILLKNRDPDMLIDEMSENQADIVNKLEKYNHDKIYNSKINEESNDDNRLKLEKYGLLDDCPLFPFVEQYSKIVAGTSIAAAEWLVNQASTEDKQNIAINWCGGRHHAHRNKASGFCYVNDIVLSITRLRMKFKKIMYIDFDLHHGDGVSKAFQSSDRILTFSIHRFYKGFFPGTGETIINGIKKGYGYDINIPTERGFDDDNLKYIVDNLINSVIHRFDPEVIVIQCGGDGLHQDYKFKEWNLTLKGYASSIINLLKNAGNRRKFLLLGGGGYNQFATAKLWTLITGVLIKGKDECLKWEELPQFKCDLINDTEYEFWSNDRKNKILNKNTQKEFDKYKAYIDKVKF